MNMNAVELGPRKGRGAVTNKVGRFERQDRVLTDDGWGVHDPRRDEPTPKLRTVLGIDTAKTVIARNKSPDVPFDQSINPYRGCEHGCVYCFARPTHAYYGLSSGLDFETRLFHKPDAAQVLRRELSNPKYVPKPIALGTNTDPYQPIEKAEETTRQVLQVLAEFNHPFTIVTKGALVTRDLDIIGPMAEKGMAAVWLSVTTLDRKLANVMEPRASTPTKRLDAVRALSEAGVPTGILMAPIIPAINDWEIERVLEASKEAGADRAGYVLLRLPHEIKDLFTEWLEAHFPDRATRVLSLVKQTRGGRLYDSTWGKRQRGEGPVADLIAKRFGVGVRKLKLDGPRPILDLSRFAVPGRAEQLSLL